MSRAARAPTSAPGARRSRSSSSTAGGWRRRGPGNAIAQAETPVFDELWERYPHTTLSASGRDVGLPDGQMGNSEVGHLNLGAGAVVKQDLARIDDAIADGSFFENEALLGGLRARRARSPRGRLHLLGPGLRRRRALRLGAHRGAASSSPPRRACPTSSCTRSPTAATRCRPRRRGYVAELERWLRQRRAGSAPSAAATTRWTATAAGSGRSSPTTRSSTREGLRADDRRRGDRRGLRARRDRRVRPPTVIGDYDGVADGDAAIHFNFRPDRARQLVAGARRARLRRVRPRRRARRSS